MKGGQRDPVAAAAELGDFNLGTRRSLSQYEKFVGIDLKSRTPHPSANVAGIAQSQSGISPGTVSNQLKINEWGSLLSNATRACSDLEWVPPAGGYISVGGRGWNGAGVDREAADFLEKLRALGDQHAAAFYRATATAAAAANAARRTVATTGSTGGYQLVGRRAPRDAWGDMFTGGGGGRSRRDRGGGGDGSSSSSTSRQISGHEHAENEVSVANGVEPGNQHLADESDNLEESKGMVFIWAVVLVVALLIYCNMTRERPHRLQTPPVASYPQQQQQQQHHQTNHQHLYLEQQPWGSENCDRKEQGYYQEFGRPVGGLTKRTPSERSGKDEDSRF